ncbi:MAG: class I SAM-dependent methyltransferase, partial [Desulfitobacterium hafniense]
DSERNQSIAKSFFDTAWFEDVHFTPEEGIMFVAGGVFYYFREEELREVVAAMARRFPGGELYFDAESKQAVDKSNRMVQKTGNQGAPMYFYVNDAAALNSWAPEISVVSCLDYFAGIPRNRQWSWRCRLLARASGWMGLMKFIHLRFSHGR